MDKLNINFNISILRDSYPKRVAALYIAKPLENTQLLHGSLCTCYLAIALNCIDKNLFLSAVFNFLLKKLFSKLAAWSDKRTI